MDIREYLKSNALVFDGGMGTYYAAKSKDPIERCEAANIKNPAQIYDIHMEYINSGARAIKTNTFAANSDNYGGSSRALTDVIESGYKIAQKAAEGRDVFVFADIGPVQDTGEKTTAQKYIDIAQIFIKLGAENFIIETLYNYDGVEELTEYIKSQRPKAFIIVSFAVQPDGYTKEGELGCELLKKAAENKNIDFVGLNCVSGPQHMYQYFKTVSSISGNFSVMPNAGYPTVINNRTLFESSPRYFAIKIRDIVKEGAKIVGGCCGTTPEYIKYTVSELLNESGTEETEEPAEKEVKKEAAAGKNDFAHKLMEGKRVLAVELDPPDNADITKFWKNAVMLSQKGIDVITIADCPIAKARADSSILACKIKRELKIDALPHITCRDRNINATKALLLGLNMEGVNNVLIVTGDPIPSAMRDEVKSVFNFNSRMLAKYVSTLNKTLFNHEFLICGALNVNSKNFDIQLKMAKEKEENGVKVLLTQPVLTQKGFENLKKAKSELKTKILAGIIPVMSYRNACFMDSEISGIDVSDEIIEMYKDKTKEECAALAVEISVEIAKRVKDFCDGYYLITPFGRADIIGKIVEGIKKFEYGGD